MGRPASWYLWLQAVDVIWRGNVKPYWCLVSKCSLSGWKLLGKLRSYRFVPCGLGGSFQCWCCVCVCLKCSWWCVDLVLFRMPRIIRSHAAAPRGHGCTQTTKKREGVLIIAIRFTFEHGDCYQKQSPKQRLLSETTSETKLEQWMKLGK